MTQKTFAVAGVSKLAGTFKARFAADLTRVKVLEKNGHTDIDLIELPEPMTKVEAAAHLIDTDFDKGNMEIRAALQAELDRFDAKSAKQDKPAKAAAPAAAAEDEAAVVAEIEQEILAGIDEEIARADNTISLEDHRACVAFADGDDSALDTPKKELSMSPDAIRKREARAAAKSTAAADAMTAWAEAADAEEAAEDDEGIAA